jgi:phage-related protein (TIGR01555 family)
MEKLKPVPAVRDDTTIEKLTGDGWENVITGHGTSRDKRVGNAIKSVSPSTDRQKWEDLYFGDDMAAKFVDVPAEDMVRKWFTLNVDNGGDDKTTRGADARANVEIADGMIQFLDDLGARSKVKEGITWAKVFGGGLILLGVNDGQDDMTTPLNEDKIRSFDFLSVYDRWEVEIFKNYSDPKLENFGEPEFYRFLTNSGSRGGPVAPEEIVHESRTIRFRGVLTNRRRKRRNDGWEDPVYVRLEEILADFGISWAGVSNLIADFSQSVFKMKGLADAVASASIAGSNQNEVLSRMSIMDLCRSSLRMIPLDAEDEDFMRVSSQVAGLADLLDRLALRLSAAGRFPVTILFGQSPTGLNTTAEGDIKIWYDRVSAMQESELRGPVERLVDLAFKSPNGPSKGSEPDGWQLTFTPLMQMSEKDAAETRKTQAETDSLYIGDGVVEPSEIRDSRFGGESYSTDTMIEDRPAEPPEPDEAMLEAMVEERVTARMAQNPPPVPPTPPEPARDDGRSDLLTSTDEGHLHSADLDFEGTGITSYTAGPGGTSHRHFVNDFKVNEVDGHTHTIEKPG